MKFIRDILDNLKPSFEKGGKLQMFHSAFDAVETLFFVPNRVTRSGTHIRDAIDMKRAMIMVVVALIPALLFGMFNVGYQHFQAIDIDASFWQTFFYGFWRVLPIVILCYAVGLTTEIITCQMKGEEVSEGLFVTSMLIPLIVPINTPLWMIAVAVIFSVVLGKEAFGGSGMNLVNPALLTRAFLFFAYPQAMSGDKVWVRLAEQDQTVDGFTGATPLGDALTGNFDRISETWSISDMIIGLVPGSIGETSIIAIALGAILLLITGIASWRIMLSVFVGGYSMGLIFNLFAVNTYMALPAWQHLILGGFAFGAVFMATDPVTAAQTNRGKYIYGLLIGALAILYRVINPAYPEGMMLAILLLNVFAPLIDYYVIESNIRKRLKRVAHH